jgi:hypothetical protein
VGQLAGLLEEFVRAVPFLPAAVAADQLDEIDDLALLEDQPVLHPGVDRPHGRVAGDLKRDLAVRHPHRHGLQPREGRAEAARLPVVIDYRELAFGDELAQHLVE